MLNKLVKERVLSQPVYEPGRPIEEVARELGLDPVGIAKLASNESPFGSSPKAVEAVRAWAEEAWLYPDGSCYELKGRLAQKRGVAPEQLVLGNGSNEIIELLGHAFLSEGDEVVFGSQAFIVYKLVTLLFGARPVANMTTSVLIVFPLESVKSMLPLPSSFKDSGVVDSHTLMPRDFNVLNTFSRISLSKPFNGNGWRKIKSTSQPKP